MSNYKNYSSNKINDEIFISSSFENHTLFIFMILLILLIICSTNLTAFLVLILPVIVLFRKRLSVITQIKQVGNNNKENDVKYNQKSKEAILMNPNLFVLNDRNESFNHTEKLKAL